MNILQNLQNILGQNSGQAGGNDAQQNGGGLSSLLGPAALGGIAGALLISKAARGIAAGALIAGGGAYLWQKYKGRMKSEHKENPSYDLVPARTSERAARLVRALVFAAKSDGHIDPKEQQAIQDSLRKLNIGTEAETLIQQALSEPLDPNLIANGVSTSEEALEIYALSYTVLDVDHFMERSYLDALAQALKIPADVKTDMEKQLSAQKQ